LPKTEILLYREDDGTMPRKHRFDSPALQHLYDRYIGDDPEQEAAYGEGLADAQVARAIYDLRTNAKLTQAALAELIHTAPSVISRLEDANDEGHSLAMLRRIAAALDRRLEIRFLPRRRVAARKRTSSSAASRKAAGRRRTGTR
jgi:DNA-binding XRE family transcriptional regulator